MNDACGRAPRPGDQSGRRPGGGGSAGLARNFRQAPVTAVISTAMCVAWLICAVQSRSIMATGDSRLAESWMLFSPEVFTGSGWLRVAGFLFIHLDISHLALNLLLGVFLGRELERSLGSLGLSAAWLFSGLGSGLAVLFFAPMTPTAGMSGALYGLMAMLVGQSLRRGHDLRAPLTLVAVNLAYTFVIPRVSLWGHLGGLAAGTVLAFCFAIPSRPIRIVAVSAVGAGIAAGIFGYIASGGF